MKRISIFKRLLILILVFMLSINSFAAIVADNDGATFITKAEFDSLKNNFQAQIDSYNMSIDSKIEGAIASYLAGIRTITEENIIPKNNKTHYRYMNDYYLEEGFCGLMMSASCLIGDGVLFDGESNLCGASAGINLKVEPTPAEGFIARTDSDNNAFLKGWGTVEETWSSTIAPSVRQLGADTVERMINTAMNWYVGWGNADADQMYYFPEDETWFGTRYARSPEWRPIMVSFEPYGSACFGRPTPIYADEMFRNRTAIITETPACFINDAPVYNIIDEQYVNGFTYYPITPNSLARETEVFEGGLIGLISAGIDGFDRDSYDRLIDANFDYGTFNVRLYREGDLFCKEPAEEGITWADGTWKWMKVSHIDNPEKIWTDSYDTENFRNWIEKQHVSYDFQTNDADVQYFNLRRGMVLFDLYDNKVCEVTCKIKNNKNSPAYLKIFTKLDSDIVDSFDNTVGMETDKTDSAAKNRMTIPAKGELIFKFDYDSTGPVFFKCSNSADIDILDIKRVIGG